MGLILSGFCAACFFLLIKLSANNSKPGHYAPTLALSRIGIAPVSEKQAASGGPSVRLHFVSKAKESSWRIRSVKYITLREKAGGFFNL